MEVTTFKKEVDVLSLVLDDPLRFYREVINRSGTLRSILYHVRAYA